MTSAVEEAIRKREDAKKKPRTRRASKSTETKTEAKAES